MAHLTPSLVLVTAYLYLTLLTTLPTSATSSPTHHPPSPPHLRVYQPTALPVGVDLRHLSPPQRSAYLQQAASVPLKGWNSYDAFGGSVNESLIRAHIDVVARDLLPLGYSVVAVDAGWYSSQGQMLLDEWGRPQVDPVRYPSAAGQRGFREVADYAHSKGLLFGIHTMVIPPPPPHISQPLPTTTTRCDHRSFTSPWCCAWGCVRCG